MKKIFTFVLLSFSLLLISLSLNAQPGDALRKFLSQDHLKHAAIGLKIIDLSSGNIVMEHNGNTSFTPGSTMKIVTSATALDVLGSNFKFETQLFYEGTISQGILNGNLIIQGAGDPTLGSDFLSQDITTVYNQFYQAIAAAGIKEINGQVIAMDQLFAYDGIPGKWMWEDMGNAYAPAVYGISIYDNTCKIELQSFQTGQDTKILSVRPEIPELRLTNEIKGDVSNADNSYVSGAPFSYERRLYGTIPQNRKSFIAKSDIPDPGLLLARELENYLSAQGIPVKKGATTYRLHPVSVLQPVFLTKHVSPSLNAIARVINERSNNHYAEHLYQLLIKEKEIDIPAFWKKRGIDSSALFMFDGSGISAANAISATFLTDILIYMDSKSSEQKPFFDSLPLAGREGTVASFLRGTSLEGQARIKSGSLTNVQSYAGYINWQGKRYAFAIIVNQYTGSRANLRKSIESLLNSLNS